MNEVARIGAREAHEMVTAGRALLVLAYKDPARFTELRLPGAISIQEFRARRSALPREQVVIFYCA